MKVFDIKHIFYYLPQ